MEKDILSLKNIYRFLMVNDYPIYSTGVFKEENRKGLTLTKFWREVLLYEFRSGYYGKMIWRTSGGRNRHTSEMCNRSEVLKWYPQYTSELVLAINEKILIQQINQFKTCLQERKYDANVLEKKIEAVITMFFTQDICFGEEVVEFFRKNLADGKSDFSKDAEARLFYAGWMLTFLSLYAMAGEEMNSVQMKKLRQNREYSLKALWEHSKEESTKKKEEVHFLTSQNNALCITPLPMMHFFGREMELFDLREILEQGGYYLLSGMGGIGKTELLRQLLHLCVEQGLMDEIAIIQYENNLKDSCMNAFPNLHLVDKDNTLNEAMARIRMQRGKRALTLVDNVNNTLEEDQDLAQLLTLPGTVILTSRLKEMDGFTTYEVKAPGRETGTLIFRDNYGRTLSKDDKEQLNQLLEQEIWCHTLSLRLLGNTAKVKGWTVGQLKEKLAADGRQLLKPREKQEINLAQMYRRMYDLSELEENQCKLLRCFALLPYRNYTLDFCQKFLAECCSEGTIREQLDNLKLCGWLSGSRNEYSMHPVVAECIMADKLTEEDAAPFLSALLLHWEKCGVKEEDCFRGWFFYTLGVEQNAYELMEILTHIVERVNGIWSEKLVKLIVLVGIINHLRNNDTIQVNHYISRLQNRQNLPELLRIWIDILGCSLNYTGNECYYEQYQVEGEKNKWLSQLYKCILMKKMLDINQLEKAEIILNSLDIAMLSPELQVFIEFNYGILHAYKTQFLESKEKCERAITLAKEYNFPKGLFLQGIYQLEIEMLLSCGDIANATEALKELAGMVEEKITVMGQYLISQCYATLNRCQGKYKEAFEAQKEVITRVQSIYGLHGECAVAYGDAALILSKMENYHEAETYFQEGIKRLQSSHMPSVQMHRIYNNMGDMYINWNKPQKAIEALEHAMEYGKDVNGIGAAEVHRNFARAYRLAGDTEKEYDNLKQAVPLLAEVYGPDHERTIAMRERLEEVEKLIG